MYKELKNQHPELKECFYAFSNQQFAEGVKEKNLEGKKILKAMYGLFGTKEGLDEMQAHYENVQNKIREQCTPQEIYNYEFVNHECEYTGDDTEALEIVENYFGKESLNTLNRFPSYLLNEN
ncbi:hypothetical protein VB796_08680 [Arcicella sp. LKC2W]|uniref:DUF7659 family protein n=1 Tax=Arcicella sp. LKC2W TaxID=2984198 RepID=UPI002B1F0BF1|nr:hypothetical protein [Arcicella sp. LKC2W]MEA5459109.1 hypothetical protein [Arcicella sp. LKC2W]